MKTLVQILLFTFSSVGLSATSSTSTSLGGWDSHHSDQSMYFQLNYNTLKATIDHKEVGSSGFSALSERLPVVNGTPSIQLVKEFQRGKRLTFLSGGAISYSKIANKSETNNWSNSGSLARFGVIGHANLNYDWNGLIRIQPFLGAQLGQQNLEYEVSYGINRIDYDFSGPYIEYAIGARFFDHTKGLMSFFALKHFQSLTSNPKSEAKIGSNTVALATAAEIEPDDVGLEVGLGFIF